MGEGKEKGKGPYKPSTTARLTIPVSPPSHPIPSKPLSFPPEAGESVASLQADRGRFQGLAAEVEGHLQELSSLAAFYSHFAAAYAALGPEAGRRRAYLGRVARVALECQQRLDALRAEEEAERARFRSAHGRYLPASLCPVIQEPPQRFAVHPDAQVQYRGGERIEEAPRRVLCRVDAHARRQARHAHPPPPPYCPTTPFDRRSWRGSPPSTQRVATRVPLL